MTLSNRDIAKAFANGATKGRNNNGTIFIDGDTIYSYGRHWPMAVREGGKIIANSGKYSRTTSKQTGYVVGACAVAGLPIEWRAFD